ncbi:MAG: fimbrillin family protein [Mediterranea sp.]|jgi:hypothetical protein|nr:fimbrillin family protein [Mediterranea sp.]
MKRYRLLNLYILPLLLTALLIGGCSDDDASSLIQQDNALTLQVSAQDFAYGAGTRATDAGYTTAFETGDAIGVSVVVDGELVQNNIRCEYNGTTWTPDDALYKYNGATYFAVYPYNADNTALQYTAADSVVAFFTPDVDQSTIEKYQANDLMTATVTNLTSQVLSFKMSHAMSLVEVTIPYQSYQAGTGVIYQPSALENFYIGSIGHDNIEPYQVSTTDKYCTYRCIVKSIVGMDMANRHSISGTYTTFLGKEKNFIDTNLLLEGNKYYRILVSDADADTPIPMN